MLNPYAEIKKVPLQGDGVYSSAYSVQMEEESKDGVNRFKELGVVGANYMLLPNKEVKEAADTVAFEVNVNFEVDKEFFDGKKYIYSLKSNDSLGKVRVNDDVALGMQFWNSYDGSRSFGFSMMLYRLICTNGMMSGTYFRPYRFRHSPNSSEWQENLEQVINNVNNVLDGTVSTGNFLSSLVNLDSNKVTTESLAYIRHNHLNRLPVSTFGSVIDRATKEMIDEDRDSITGWDLLNAGTGVLWHKEKPNYSHYNQNQMIVDGLIKAYN